MDADSMTRKDAYRETLRDFRAGKIDILVGTQMIAKGLHFPNVTLVGIINADLALHLPDFRAGERTFQLLTQVAGRAGRGETPGEVFVQTLHAVFAVDPVCAASRFRRLFPAGTRVPGALRFPAIQTRDPCHGPFRPRGAREILCRNITPPLEGSIGLLRRSQCRKPFRAAQLAAGREGWTIGVYLGRCRARSLAKTPRPIPVSHSDSRRSDHASEPPHSRDARQAAFP